jgi:hypothetical protein
MVLPRPETISKVLGRLLDDGGSLLAGSPGAEATDPNALFESLEDPVLLLSGEAFMAVVSPSLVGVLGKASDALTE